MGLEGIHNIDNALAASTLAIKYGLKHRFINQALKEIEPLNHRMELVTEVDGIKFYNDSKATNIESTIAAIRSFKKNIILILGGRDKGETNYEKLLEFELGKIKSIVTYGEAGKKIKQQLEIKYLIKYCEKFNEATKISINNSIKGDIVLLSPSCSSFDQFKNYEDRGNYFKKIIFEKYHLC